MKMSGSKPHEPAGRPLIPVAALLGQAAAKTAPDRLHHYIVLSC
jgi:hypothetical protein